jgi:hypothetical protein
MGKRKGRVIVAVVVTATLVIGLSSPASASVAVRDPYNAGYRIDDGTTVSSLTARFEIPAVTCEDAKSNRWIDFGIFTDYGVAAVSAKCQYSKTPMYFAEVGMWAGDGVEIFSAHAGDAVVVRFTETAADLRYAVSINGAKHSLSFPQGVPADAHRWIGAYGIGAVPTVGNVHFTMVNVNGLPLSKATTFVRMNKAIGTATPQMTTTVLNNVGTAFGLVFHHQ